MIRRIKGHIIHWSVTSVLATVDEIRQIHLNKGYRDIGYHRVILHPLSNEFKGKTPVHWWELVKLGRHLDDDLYLSMGEVGAHSYGYNKSTVGTVVVGKPGVPLAPLQKEALVQTARIFAKRFDFPLEQTKGHREVYATQCPGLEIMNVIKDIRREL